MGQNTEGAGKKSHRSDFHAKKEDETKHQFALANCKAHLSKTLSE